MTGSFKGVPTIMNTRLEQLRLLQRKRQCLYEAYQREEMDTQAYLLAIYPLDCAVDRLELSYLLGRLQHLGKRHQSYVPSDNTE
jgi:hypothetical protein